MTQNKLLDGKIHNQFLGSTTNFFYEKVFVQVKFCKSAVQNETVNLQNFL